MEIFFVWIIASFIVGIIGSNRKIGFGSSFFISLLLSPLIGLIFVLTSKSKESDNVQNNSIADEIEKLQNLRNNNSITEYEFIRLKNKIIDPTNREEHNYSVNENEKTNSNDKKPSFFTKPKVIVNTIFIVILLTVGLYIYSINSSDTNSDFKNNVSEIAVDKSAIISDTPTETAGIKGNTLKNFTYEDVARYAMATSMQEPVGIVKSQKKDNYFYVAYVRPSDSQKFEFKVKFEGNRIIWGDLNGRWQDTEYDEKISFEEIGNKINIIGVGDTVEFKKGD
ncbi:hypothetical protein ACFX5D_01360 [Flavobacterium sp. LB3P45]|uniref:SHOCT domain-containing protein n=1 Tax=Flavobacterium fructosi TaxID=3230416 RepID=A0ABW6HHW5_9FLAO